MKSASNLVRDDPRGLSIRNRLRFLVKDSALYGGAAALSKAFGLITFPLLARRFPVADYGLIDFYAVLGVLITIFLIFGQDSAVARFFYEYQDEESRCRLISQSLALQIVFMLLVLPPLWLSADLLGGELRASSEAEVLFRLVLLQVPFLVLVNFSQALLKWTFSRTLFLIISLGSVVLNTLLLLLGILVFNIGVAGVFQVNLGVQVVFGLLGLYFVRHWLVFPDGIGFLRELLPYAIPYGAICCVSVFVPTMERWLVNGFLGSHELGLYAAGAKVAMLISLVISAFQTAWGPFSLAIHKEPDAAHTYNWALKGFALGICAVVLFVSAIAESLISLLASDRYAGAAIVVFPLAMGLAIQATSWITEIGSDLSKKTYLSLYSYTVFVSVTAASIYVLGTAYGLLGIALGVMVGHIAKSVTASWLAQRAYPLPWVFRPVLFLIAGTVLVGLLGAWSGATFSPVAGSAIHGAGALILPAAGWFLLFCPDDRHRIISEIRDVSIRFMRSA